jgi:farnesyl diphosphate synthase
MQTMRNPDQFNTWVAQLQTRTEQVLFSNMPSAELTPSTLHTAMRYAVLGGGKRIRALLTYATAEFFSVPTPQVDIAAAAVELIHAFSLVHDDMPCMDNDDLRRGKPATHKQFGDATALLVGDALQTLAFEWLASDRCVVPAAQKVQLLYTLAVATGSVGMAGGQSIDLESTNQQLSIAQLEQMHQYKTGALIRAAALLGAYSASQADAQKLRAIETYIRAIGLAFQVVDDILDAEADTATLGKTAGKDAAQNKSTYVSLIGLPAAKALAEDLYNRALSSLGSYGDEAYALRGLATLVTQRDS